MKDSIPIRTWAEWNDAVPGFVEIDLVGHEGGNAVGEHYYTTRRRYFSSCPPKGPGGSAAADGDRHRDRCRTRPGAIHSSGSVD